MASVKEDELELGAGSLGLGFGPFAGGNDGSKNGQHLGWNHGESGGSIHSSRQKPDQGGDADVDDGGGGGGSGGWFFTNNNNNNNNNNNSRPPPNLTPAVYWFTTDQWRELQVQGMIYKHLVAGMPIPQEFLRELGWPVSQNTQQMMTTAMAAQYYADRTGGAGINVSGHPALLQHHLLPGVAGNAPADPEPQRCRRTDGKKWRCGNEAAPGKRYCDKHLHRSRPRSRKPVEPQQVQQQFLPPHAPLVPSPPNKFGITAAVYQELPSQAIAPGRKHPCPPMSTTRTEAPPPPNKNDITSSWNMDRKKAKSEEDHRGSEQDTVRQHHHHHLGQGGKLNKPEQQHFLWQPQQQQMEPQQQQHSYYPYAAYQDDTFFSLLNSDINSVNERHLSFTTDPWSTSAGNGTLSMSHSTEPAADRYINFDNNNSSTCNSLSPSVSSAPSGITQSPHLSLLVPGARENAGMQVPMGLTNASGTAATAANGGDSTKTPPLWWLADTLITGPSSDMPPTAGTGTGTATAANQHPTTTDDEAGVVSPNTTADSSAAASPTGVLQRPLASISDCSSNSSEAPFAHLHATGTGGGAQATGHHHLHWMIKP